MPLDTAPMPHSALVCAVMAGSPAVLAQTRHLLAARVSPVRLAGEPYDFTFTRYYDREMGSGLVKQLVWLERFPSPCELATMKRTTMELERELAVPEAGRVRRRANIDPGLVTIESLVLATTKYAGHRVCIDAGLYAEVTLLYQKGRYAPLPWTYPDFRTEPVQRLLNQIRAHLRTGPTS